MITNFDSQKVQSDYIFAIELNVLGIRKVLISHRPPDPGALGRVPGPRLEGPTVFANLSPRKSGVGIVNMQSNSMPGAHGNG